MVTIVKPIKLKGRGKVQPLGHELFDQLAASIYISAGTKSGKTTLISHILDQCIDKNTTVYIFAPTVNIDKTYAHIMKRLKKRNIPYEAYPHFIDPDGHNLLDGIVNQIIQQHDKPAEQAAPVVLSHRIVAGQIVREFAPQQKPDLMPDKPDAQPTHAPKYMFIFDDLGEEMRHKSVYKWLLKQRQFFAKTIISTQSINNLMPNSIGQLDYVIVFGGQRDESVEQLRRKLDLPIGNDEFAALYKEATKEKYHFLNIDRREVILRRDFGPVLYAGR